MLAACFFGLVGLTTFLLCLSETAPFNKVLFESVSAVTTTGLTLGITSQLTPFGKVVIIAAMILGRVGPLALVAALSFAGHTSRRTADSAETMLMG